MPAANDGAGKPGGCPRPRRRRRAAAAAAAAEAAEAAAKKQRAEQAAKFQAQIDEIEKERATLADNTHPEVRFSPPPPSEWFPLQMYSCLFCSSIVPMPIFSHHFLFLLCFHPHPQPICSLRNQIIARSGVLRKMCDRRTAAAVKFRDLQIENIKGLYDYEIREADSGVPRLGARNEEPPRGRAAPAHRPPQAREARRGARRRPRRQQTLFVPLQTADAARNMNGQRRRMTPPTA